MLLINRSLPSWSRIVFASLTTGLLALMLTPLASANKPSDNVKQVQQTLVDKGYDPGPVDGVMGSKTRDAIGKYQQAENLPVTNHLDSKTADKLGVPQESASGKFKAAGHDFAKGGKEFGHEISKGKPVDAGKDLGKGVGEGGKNTGEGTAKAVTP
jgi:peptidoglycan hydrolase-like protein with peptidoglycan-binding domain